MEQLIKRFKSGAWIGFAGIVSTVFLLVIENISRFDLSESQRAITVIVLTSIVAQITKWLNTRVK